MMNDMSTFMLRPEAMELELAWQEIERRFGDVSCTDLETGEVWQYLGTWWNPTLQRFAHHFRHRCLKGRRVVQEVAATEGWMPSEATVFPEGVVGHDYQPYFPQGDA